ncbi:MAG TPA: Rieske (2Fe-2S) protein [Polyangiaceae bacterium]|nr:Rieske (2Fe-2S) protein [Polyangiaceae bacterium]
MSDCDTCRRALLGTGMGGVVVLLVPGCGGGAVDPPGPGEAGPEEAGGDDAFGDDAGDSGEGGEGGACKATCSTGAKTLELTFAKFPQLKNVGGSTVANAPGYKDPTCGLDVIVVAQPSAGQYVAFSAGCPHQCCTVAYNKSRTEFMCPCHGSTFNTSGQVTGGPAPSGLQKLSVCADDCGVYVSYP